MAETQNEIQRFEDGGPIIDLRPFSREQLLNIFRDRIERGYTERDIIVNEVMKRLNLPIAEDIRRHRGTYNLSKPIGKRGNIDVRVNPKRGSFNLQYTGKFQDGGSVDNFDVFDYLPSAGQAANVGGMLLPGSGYLDYFGGYATLPSGDQPFSEAFSGERYPSFAENVQRGGFGGYFDAAMQGLGAAGDTMYALPLIGAVTGPTIGTGLKAAGLTGKLIKRGIGALSRSNADEALKAIENVAADKGIKLDIFEKDGVIDLSRIVVPEKGQGVGSEMMRQIIDYADQTGQTIKLTPSKDFGASSVGRLIEFYKKFGFVENKGRNKTFEFRDSMYRPPVALRAGESPAAEIDQGIGALPRPVTAETKALIGDVPNNINIVPDTNLSGEMADIQRRFSEQLNANVDSAVADYARLPDSDGGRIVNTDLARELSPDYQANRSLSSAVHEPASAFTKEYYRRMLSVDAPPGKYNRVLFTGGGTGAGKTTALKDALLDLNVNSQIIYDTNMAGLNSSVDKIDQALDANKQVTLAYVYRDPIESLVNGAIRRAKRQESELGTGRTVPLTAHASTHARSNETMRELVDHYADNPNVETRIIDNSLGPGNAKDMGNDLSVLPRIDYNQVLKEGTDELTKAFSEGRISEQIYKGFLPD